MWFVTVLWDEKQGLFDGHRLGQIARLVDIAASHNRDVVGQNLQGHCRQQGRIEAFCLWDLDDVVCHLAGQHVFLADDSDDLAVARLHLLYVTQHLLLGTVIGGDEDHRHILVYHSDRTVLHLGGGIAFGVDVRDFLQFQGTFKSHRIVL